jgi:citrate lyase subunit beta/citryl-CoA lyase
MKGPAVALNRTFLFAPGNHPRRVEKALALGADAVILDLEDAVAITDKAAARKPVAEALKGPRRCRGYVRPNAPASPFCYRDLVETIHDKVDGIVLPKVESAADLHAIDWLLAALERERGIVEGSIDLIPMVETAAGVARVDRILQARSLRPYRAPWRVKRVAFGAGDFSLEAGLIPSHDEPELAEARARVVLASRAAGMEAPLDSPWFHLRDEEGFRRALERSRRGGFQGRMCVHPDQVPIANATFTPSADEVARAERIVRAFKEAEARGAAAVEVDGQMVDYPIVYRAQALLEAMREIRAQGG